MVPLQVTYRGGPESWWLVTARGRHGCFPGHLALEDVMAQVLNEAAFAGDAAGTAQEALRARRAANRRGSARG